jgi:alpha-tubulin suppressor-like RCC1 family protein
MRMITLPQCRQFRGAAVVSVIALGACGDGVTPPPPPEEFEIRWSSVVAGGGGFSAFTCGLTESGAAYCWGSQDGGALGSQGTNDVVSPVEVAGGHTFRSLTAGWRHACGVRVDGATYCWGTWELGALSSPDPMPRRIAAGVPLVALTAASWSTCGLAADGAAWCWSGHPFHEVHGMTPHPNPTAVDHRFRSIAAGSASGDSYWCGVDLAGAAWCWGSGFYGTLGDGRHGDGVASARPVRVAGGLTFETVSAGYIACGLGRGGAVHCWGAEVTYPPFQARAGGSVPAVLHGGIAFDTLSVGSWHACGLASGRAYCWGNNLQGQLGDGSTASGSNTPVPVAGGLTFRTIAAGNGHSCGTTTDGQAWCWGNHGSGQLGDGSPIPADKFGADARTPVRVRVIRR